MRYILAIICIMVFSGGAFASSLCTFDTKCVEAEACIQTHFELRFGAGTGGPNELQIVTETDTVGVAVGGNSKIAFLAGLTERGFHVLTVASGDGAARYTNHLSEGPVTISYLGHCELGQ